MKSATKKPTLSSDLLHELASFFATTISKMSRGLTAFWNAVPESYSVASEADLKKMVGEAENLVVFNGRIIRVNQPKKSDGNLPTQDV